MNRFLFHLAVVLYAVSVAVHANTFIRIVPTNSLPWIWVLHVGIFVVFIPGVLGIKKTTKIQKVGLFDFYGNWRAQKEIFLDGIPIGLKVLIGASFIYAIVNFILAFGSFGHSTLSNQNGKRYIRESGKPEREITEAEFNDKMENVLRGFSGHWMLFYLVSACMLLKLSNQALPDDTSGRRGRS
jgi:hypothetical protein